MTRILFVCHGNICRSVMAEYMFKNMIKGTVLQDLEISSAATSTEEIGNDIYPPARRILSGKGIPFEKHHARQIKADYDEYDLLIGMDTYNIRNMLRFFGGDPSGKIRMLLDRPVSDPWYTGDFETAYLDIQEGLQNLFEELKSSVTR